MDESAELSLNTDPISANRYFEQTTYTTPENGPVTKTVQRKYPDETIQTIVFQYEKGQESEIPYSWEIAYPDGKLVHASIQKHPDYTSQTAENPIYLETITIDGQSSAVTRSYSYGKAHENLAYLAVRSDEHRLPLSDGRKSQSVMCSTHYRNDGAVTRTEQVLTEGIVQTAKIIYTLGSEHPESVVRLSRGRLSEEAETLRNSLRSLTSPTVPSASPFNPVPIAENPLSRIIPTLADCPVSMPFTLSVKPTVPTNVT